MNRRKASQSATAAKHEMTGGEFLSLPLPERQKIMTELEAESPEDRLARSTPLTPVLRRRWSKFNRAVTRNTIRFRDGAVSSEEAAYCGDEIERAAEWSGYVG